MTVSAEEGTALVEEMGISALINDDLFPRLFMPG